MALSGDVVIAKDIDQPLYNFAVVVDDALNGITHVIRGEEHLSIRRTFLSPSVGFNVPQFAHLPLILNADRTKMSSGCRTLRSTIIARRLSVPGCRNLMAFFGWHPKEDKDVMNLTELAAEFDLKRVRKPARYSTRKLDWFNVIT